MSLHEPYTIVEIEEKVDEAIAEERSSMTTLTNLHLSDIDALKEIVIGLTARVNELEFASGRKMHTYIPGAYFNHNYRGH